MTPLRSCDGCKRHVFVSELRCPFCAQSLRPVEGRAPSILQAGLSRAQRYAVAAAVAGSAAGGCSKYHEEPQSPAGNGAPSTAGTSGAMGAAGAAGNTSNTAGAGAGNGAGGAEAIPQPMYGGGFPQPVYGAPFPGVAGSAGGPGGSGGADAGSDDDAGVDETPPVAPAYGAPFP